MLDQYYFKFNIWLNSNILDLIFNILLNNMLNSIIIDLITCQSYSTLNSDITMFGLFQVIKILSKKLIKYYYRKGDWDTCPQ